MGLLKKLSQLTSQNGKMDVIKPKTEVNEKITYHDDGYNTSNACQGNAHNLQISLDTIYQKFENKCKTDFNEQERLKQPYVTEQKVHIPVKVIQ